MTVYVGPGWNRALALVLSQQELLSGASKFLLVVVLVLELVADCWQASLLGDGCDEFWWIAKDDCGEPVLPEDKELWSLTIGELWHSHASYEMNKWV
jgi:hypothetical protein